MNRDYKSFATHVMMRNLVKNKVKERGTPNKN
jgi:hypothetical protein